MKRFLRVIALVLLVLLLTATYAEKTAYLQDKKRTRYIVIKSSTIQPLVYEQRLFNEVNKAGKIQGYITFLRNTNPEVVAVIKTAEDYEKAAYSFSYLTYNSDAVKDYMSKQEIKGYERQNYGEYYVQLAKKYKIDSKYMGIEEIEGITFNQKFSRATIVFTIGSEYVNTSENFWKEMNFKPGKMIHKLSLEMVKEQGLWKVDYIEPVKEGSEQVIKTLPNSPASGYLANDLNL
ncbi:MAG: hypothetical protein WA131_04100 [Desulfitobacteriaceae bacterium]